MQIFIDPTYDVHLGDRLFINEYFQDSSMALPYVRLKMHLEKKGISLNTVDVLFDNIDKFRNLDFKYWSLGNTKNIQTVYDIKGSELDGLIVLEPPLITPSIYKNISHYSKFFKKLYLHNTVGDGYSLHDIPLKKLEKLYIPQPYQGVIDHYWNNINRENKIVIIAGNHNKFLCRNELYSLRLKFIQYFSQFDDFLHLYGRNWNNFLSSNSLNINYLLSLNAINRVLRGKSENKLTTLSRYKYSFCAENTSIKGYITEKIFDCFYTGTVPIYTGPTDIKQYINTDSVILLENFSSFKELYLYINTLNFNEYMDLKCAGRKFIENYHHKFTNSLINIIY